MSAPLLESFAPLAAPDARLLVLGTMPGARSLEAGEYYAHPQNAFWPIMGALFGFDPRLAYDKRVRRLTGAGVAVWDVLRACRRDGSLDSAIDPGTALANDFQGFFERQPALRRIVFNGGAAERLFRRHASKVLDARPRLACLRLPSTSPTHARLRFPAKLEAWRDLAA